MIRVLSRQKLSGQNFESISPFFGLTSLSPRIVVGISYLEAVLLSFIYLLQLIKKNLGFVSREQKIMNYFWDLLGN